MEVHLGRCQLLFELSKIFRIMVYLLFDCQQYVSGLENLTTVFRFSPWIICLNSIKSQICDMSLNIGFSLLLPLNVASCAKTGSSRDNCVQSENLGRRCFFDLLIAVQRPQLIPLCSGIGQTFNCTFLCEFVHLCNTIQKRTVHAGIFAGQHLLARRLVRTALGLYMICALTWHVLDQYSIWAWNIFFLFVESEEIRCLASFLYVWRPSTPPAVNGKGSPWHQPYTQSPRTLQCHDGKSFQEIVKHKKI